MALLETHALQLRIPGRPRSAPLQMTVRPGERWGVLGPNGVGKTTLLHTLAGLYPPAAGSIWLDGAPLEHWGRRRVAQRVAFLFQEQHDDFPASVLETALIGRHPHLRAWDLESPEDRLMALHALERVDLKALAERQVNTLSGGERQRLAVASVLTQDPALYLLDEPTNHLDLRHQVETLQVFHGEAARGRALCMSLHDINIAAAHCDRLVLLYPDGRLEVGPTEALLERRKLETLYDQPLQRLVSETGTPVFTPRLPAR